jgi:hypothetical protein
LIPVDSAQLIDEQPPNPMHPGVGLNAHMSDANSASGHIEHDISEKSSVSDRYKYSAGSCIFGIDHRSQHAEPLLVTFGELEHTLHPTVVRGVEQFYVNVAFSCH